jgi:hypothetical protein
MKKLLLIVLLPFFLFSCNFPEYYFYTVKNESQKTISYTFNSGSTYTLVHGGHKEHQSKAGAVFTGIENVDAGNSHGFGISVRLTRNHNVYTFIPVEPYDLKVINKLPIEVTLESDFLSYNGQTKLTLSTEDGEISAQVYKINPDFKISPSGYSIIADQKFENNTVYVVIR